MAIPAGLSHTIKDHLKTLIEKWATSRTLTATVEFGNDDLQGTITEPRIYICERDGYPYYDEDKFLNVGYRIKFKYTEVQLSEALEQLTDTVEDLMDYIHYYVGCNLPKVFGSSPLNSPWIGVEIEQPDYVTTFTHQEGYNSNRLHLDVAFRVPVTKRTFMFPPLTISR